MKLDAKDVISELEQLAQRILQCDDVELTEQQSGRLDDLLGAILPDAIQHFKETKQYALYNAWKADKKRSVAEVIYKDANWRALIHQGKLIDAIKIIRQLTGYGIEEAKNTAMYYQKHVTTGDVEKMQGKLGEEITVMDIMALEW